MLGEAKLSKTSRECVWGASDLSIDKEIIRQVLAEVKSRNKG